MIRGYVAVLSVDSPLPDVTKFNTSYRKATVRLVLNDSREFYIRIEGTDYCFKVAENIRTVDSSNTASGVLRIGFISPNLDLVIYGNHDELETFVFTVEAVKEPTLPPPPKCSDSTHKRRLGCICRAPRFARYQHRHTDWGCPMSVSSEMCAFCCFSVLESYNDDDACRIINTWKSKLVFEIHRSDRHIVKSVSVKLYPYLRHLVVREVRLVEIPEQLGSLPSLVNLDLSCNRLGQATNWNWLTSPFLRENLKSLYLGGNKLCVIPEPVVRLRNLNSLTVPNCRLTELPGALGNLKKFRDLDISNNKLKVLPGWVYRKEAFSLFPDVQYFKLLYSTGYHKPQLNPSDFENVKVPSLFKTVVRYIIAERVAYWEYNIPLTLVDVLEAAYLCRCGSVVFPNSGGRVLRCGIALSAITQRDNDVLFDIFIALHLCSYKCYQLIEPFMLE